MGVLNVTPDSFSDGGVYLDPERAITHGLDLLAEGADVVDVGGESTRPGAEPVDPAEERRRVLPVITALAPHGRVSIDTRHAAVAAAAIEAGATLVNDVSATLYPVAAANGAGWVAMHMRGEPQTMQHHPVYGDVVSEVRDFLVERAETAVAAGVKDVWIDPGFGFGKTAAHNLSLLRHIEALVDTGFPVVVGVSRKAFIGRLMTAADGGPGAEPAQTGDRLEGSLATAAWAMSRGVRMVRAHDVLATVQAAHVVTGRPMEHRGAA
jgi:dihydropteroate synthase